MVISNEDTFQIALVSQPANWSVIRHLRQNIARGTDSEPRGNDTERLIYKKKKKKNKAYFEIGSAESVQLIIHRPGPYGCDWKNARLCYP